MQRLLFTYVYDDNEYDVDSFDDVSGCGFMYLTYEESTGWRVF